MCCQAQTRIGNRSGLIIHIDTAEQARERGIYHSVICGQPHPLKKCPVICFRKMDSGDFAMFDQCTPAHWLGIERKRAGDLLGAMAKKNSNGNPRLYDQLERMSKEYTHRYLFIEGMPEFDPETKFTHADGHKTEWRFASVHMMLWSWCERFGVKLWPPIPDTYATAEILRVMHNRSIVGCVLPSSLQEKV